MLGTPQSFRFGGRIEMRLRTVLPGQPLQRRFPDWSLLRRRDRQQSALAFHHHRAGLGITGPDQREAGAAVPLGDAANPFRSGPGLAETAARHDQPDRPIALGRPLLGPRPERPAIQKIQLLLFAQQREKRLAIPRLQPGKQLRLVDIIHHHRRPVTLPAPRPAPPASAALPACLPVSGRGWRAPPWGWYHSPSRGSAPPSACAPSTI